MDRNIVDLLNHNSEYIRWKRLKITGVREYIYGG